MKQLTMTKVLTPLAALAFAFGVQAAIVPVETFDTYTAGTTVISNQTGWSFTYGTDGADDASAVTAYDNNAPASGILPDGQSAGSNYLKLSTEDGTLFRNMSTDGNTLDINAGLFVDTDVQFTVTDASDSPTNSVDGADKLVIWLEDQGAAGTNLCVLGKQFGATSSDRSDKVYTLSPEEGALAIVPGNWYRLTVKASRSIPLSNGNSLNYPAFQVFVNGMAFKANEYIAETANQTALGIADFDDYTRYIPSRDAAMEALTKVGFSGEGALDSVVVTKDVPAFENPTILTFTWDSSVINTVDLDELGVSLSASGSSVSVYPGQQVTLGLNGYSATTHSLDITSSVDAYATVSDLAVTAVAAGAATIAITTTAKDTVDVTFSWADLRTAFDDSSDANISSIQFAYGGVVESAPLGERRAAHTINGLKVGTNITVTVTLDSSVSSDWTTIITPASCMTKVGNVLTINSRPDEGTATVNISAVGAAVKIGDTPYASLQEAVNAATSGATLTLAQNITLTEAVTVADGKTLTVDLNGKTITGAADVAVFTNAGTLTITDSSTNHDGAVTAGAEGVVVANTGTLNLVYGAYTGAFTGEISSITANCSFSYDISAGESPVYDIANGYEMAVEAGRYSLAAITYTITYKKGDAEITPALSPANYTIEDDVTLPTATADAGYTFTGWKDAGNNDVTSWEAGDKTGNLVLTAQFSQNTYTITVGAPASPVTVAATKNSAAATITENAITANYGDTVVVTYSAPAGYNLTGTALYEFTVTQNESTTAPTATAIEYSVTYNLDLTGATNATDAVTAFTVETPTFALLEAGCEGYTFNGWTNANGSAVTQVALGTTADVVVYATWTADAPETPTVDPTDPTTPAEVKAASAEAAIAAVAIAAPAGVDAADYKALFDFSATEKPGESGTYEVTVTGIKDTVEQAVTVSAAEIVDGTSADNKVAVPAGLYYEITTMESLGGTATVVGRGISDGNGVNVSKPGTTQGFIKVKIGTAPFSE